MAHHTRLLWSLGATQAWCIDWLSHDYKSPYIHASTPTLLNDSDTQYAIVSLSSLIHYSPLVAINPFSAFAPYSFKEPNTFDAVGETL